MYKKFTTAVFCLIFSLSGYANNESKADEPLFKDGKGYYSYVQPIKVEIPQGKVLIQYFYQYGCNVCLNADDYLKAYAERNADKVVLQRSPAFEKGDKFTARMQTTLMEFNRPELVDKYLFDSVDTIPKDKLINDNEAIKRWLTQHDIPVEAFHEVFMSEKVAKQVDEYYQHYNHYSPPRTPIAVLNGKYILISNTLYNDEYTYAVLDFLVEKLQQEQESK